MVLTATCFSQSMIASFWGQSAAASSTHMSHLYTACKGRAVHTQACVGVCMPCHVQCHADLEPVQDVRLHASSFVNAISSFVDAISRLLGCHSSTLTVRLSSRNSLMQQCEQSGVSFEIIKVMPEQTSTHLLCAFPVYCSAVSWTSIKVTDVINRLK